MDNLYTLYTEKRHLHGRDIHSCKMYRVISFNNQTISTRHIIIMLRYQNAVLHKPVQRKRMWLLSDRSHWKVSESTRDELQDTMDQWITIRDVICNLNTG